ncbi:pyridoxine 5'-phosphate synthase [Haliangium ochraceum]|uniref:Pyridoxine 5'-phosphate synthase n=1 Tax=Haliangium ochraceum (strain DSM 14365 / JCM 11303 / SMP-2) TaxID=502025 RepID=D0LTR7_HALO1|nr:pyridoxine 5'-phosphate synthase [Haliangium ochraceum]ACY15761.1 Pyridoxine 5'-phosphate synthase [Haliangium ochraceum DSM 14365]
MAINLSVNLNKVALLRNSRGADNPCPVRAAEACIAAGAPGLTLHWREDERHTREGDVRALRKLADERGVEFNLEGDARPAIVAIALELRVTQFTLVPVTPGEITSDHGWDLPREHDTLAPILERCRAAGVRTSIFMDPVAENMAAAARTGVDRVEIYTEPYAAAFGTATQDQALAQTAAAVAAARARGLGVNAGHDLDLYNLPLLARAAPGIDEVSIGHALIADALYWGLERTVRAYLDAARGVDIAEPPQTRPR